MILDPFLQKELPGLELARLAFETADGLSAEQVQRRAEPGVKEFLEEVLPLATFAKAIEGPERHIWVRYLGPNSAYDAEARFAGAYVDRGFLDANQFLEVTSAVAPYDYLQREALATDGSVFGGPNIRREGSRHQGGRVVSEPVARDGEDEANDTRDWVISAIRSKARRNYSQPSTLIVRVQAETPLNLHEWLHVIEGAHEQSTAAASFKACYLVDISQSVAFKAW